MVSRLSELGPKPSVHALVLLASLCLTAAIDIKNLNTTDLINDINEMSKGEKGDGKGSGKGDGG